MQDCNFPSDVRLNREAQLEQQIADLKNQLAEKDRQIDESRTLFHLIKDWHPIDDRINNWLRTGKAKESK